MPDPAYQPGRGDLVYLNFTPQAGTEQAGRRPALVLSPQAFNIATGLVVACPITNQVKGSPFEVALPKGAKLTGVVLSNQMRSVDWIAREISFHSKVDTNTLWDVLGRIEAILSIEL
ncbi:MAG: type II toxin-antitoxin system PemK/MazF family toxin [Pseudomonadota bacterium]